MMQDISTSEDATVRPGAFWSRQQIKACHDQKPLFWLPGKAPQYKPGQRVILEESRLGAASYNLLMGSEAYITPVSESNMRSVRSLVDGEAFMIPPGQFAFLLTHEAVDVPSDAFAFLALRAKALKFRGLVNVSGFHVDPGYNGRLVLAVYNAGPGQIHMRQGEPLFEVFFADLDQTTDRPYQNAIFRIEPGFITPIAGQFETLKGLSAKIEDVQSDIDSRVHAIEREQGIVRWASALLVGAAIAFGIRACSMGESYAPSAPVEGVAHE
jgi:dCTP deaminase